MHLLDVVDCQPKERILEVGVGTGATLVEMAATYPNSKLYGVEASPSMFAAATTRLKLCGLDNKVALQIVDPSSNLPFYGGGFDKIYIESVLAIQEGEHLRRLLEQVNRSLAPGGKLYV